MRIYFTGVIIILKDDFETNSILTDCAAVMIYDKFHVIGGSQLLARMLHRLAKLL